MRQMLIAALAGLAWTTAELPAHARCPSWIELAPEVQHARESAVGPCPSDGRLRPHGVVGPTVHQLWWTLGRDGGSLDGVAATPTDRAPAWLLRLAPADARADWAAATSLMELTATGRGAPLVDISGTLDGRHAILRKSGEVFMEDIVRAGRDWHGRPVWELVHTWFGVDERICEVYRPLPDGGALVLRQSSHGATTLERVPFPFGAAVPLPLDAEDVAPSPRCPMAS